MVAIPRILAHIWVGHRAAPRDWMDSWRDHHPDWDWSSPPPEVLLRYV